MKPLHFRSNATWATTCPYNCTKVWNHCTSAQTPLGLHPFIGVHCIYTLSLCSVSGGCSLTSFSHWGMLLHFVQSLGDAPSLRSVANIAPRFASSLGVLLTSLRRFPLNCSIELLTLLYQYI